MIRLRYWKVYWHHEFPGEPVALYSEIGPEGYETRRVEEFRGARMAWAGPAGGELAPEPFQDIDEVRWQPEFTAFVIGRDEFDAVWRRATGATAEPGERRPAARG